MLHENSSLDFAGCIYQNYEAGIHKESEFQASFVSRILNCDNDFVFLCILSSRCDNGSVFSKTAVLAEGNAERFSNFFSVLVKLRQQHS